LIALLIGIAVINTNAGTISKPLPTPNNPVMILTTAPPISNATVHFKPTLLQIELFKLDIALALIKLQIPITIIIKEKLSIKVLFAIDCQI
jgi:hypothetical protein